MSAGQAPSPMHVFLQAAHALSDAFHALGVMPYLWPVAFIGSCVMGVRIVMHHMRHGRVALSDGQVIGSKTHTDHSGATWFRGAERVARRPSLSPFYGRPAFWRGLPPPAIVAYAWALSAAPAPVGVATAAGAGYLIYRSVRKIRVWRHERRIVRPMTRALAPQLGVPADRILEGIVIPPNHLDPAAVVQIPLPDEWRPHMITEAVRITGERLGGEWKQHNRSPYAPYFVTLCHKPAPPSLVTFEDVAEKMATAKLFHPFLGVGTEREDRYLDFEGQVVHFALSARTGAGKSTVNRALLTQNAIVGVPRQAGIDVKGDSFEGSEHVPGFELYNDIGDLDTYSGMPGMWKVIRSFALEMDARRRGLRGPKDTWEPWFLFLEEQNMFAEFTANAWALMREKDDPKICPVYTDIRNIGFMGRSFKIRMVWAGQNMSADALGGGNMSKGGELRAQFGNKLLGRFLPAMWDNLVGTRPRAESSEIPGRWQLVNNANHAQAVQIPLFEPQHSMELLAYAGHRLSPTPSPNPLSRPSHELPGPAGDWGTEDPNTTRPDNVVPIRAREQAILTPDYTQREMRTPESPLERYSIEEASEKGIIGMGIEQAKKARTRTRKNHPGMFPEGLKEGRGPETYTADELREWVHWYHNDRKAQ